MRITVLTENTSCDPAIGYEHGLSLYIETARHRLLFDMGQSDLFAENAAALGVDLGAVDAAILSHGHYDHGGGLRRFLSLNRNAPVYLSRYAFEPHYNGTEKYIGLDASLSTSDRLIFTDNEYRIDDELTLISCNDRSRRYPLAGGGLNAVIDDRLVPDDFRHEQYLMIREGERRVLISGCSHKGVLNIVEWLRPDVLVGGFHLMNESDRGALEQIARALDAFPVAYYTCHCTGAEQFAVIKRHMKNLTYIRSGQRITISTE